MIHNPLSDKAKVMNIDLKSLMGDEESRKRILGYFSRRRYSPLLALLAKNNLSVSHILDVGVRHGTHSLYKAFPDAFFILYDPQEGGESLLRVKPVKYSFANIALGQQPGVLAINEMGAKTTFKERTPLTEKPIQKKYDVVVSTLDAVINSLDCSLIGIKIDTEGYELEVVKGLNQFVHKVAFIEAEVSLKKRFTDSYRFSELVSELDAKGFVVAGCLNHGYGRMPRLLDLIFVNKTLFVDY
jgi:FkbM family methyltransferase